MVETLISVCDFTLFMLTEADFELGRRELEALLNREVSETASQQDETVGFWHEKAKSDGFMLGGVDSENLIPKLVREWLINNKKLLYLRTSISEIVGKGTHQAVIELGNRLVAKVPHRRTDWDNDDTFSIDGGYLFTKMTQDELVGLGFDVPPIKFYRITHNPEGVVVSSDVAHENWGDQYRDDSVNWGERRRISMYKCPDVCITSDLRENGRYKIVEYDEETARKSANGEVLIEQFNADFELLMDHLPTEGAYERANETLRLDKPELQYEPHKLKTPEEAIRKMFLLQVPMNENEEGKLVVGDIDHVYFYR